jgi:TrmH family RNA methyltransferase
MLSKNEIKYYSSLKKKKYREQEGKFLIEGYHLVKECLGSPYSIECVVYSETITPDKNDELLVSFGKKNIPVHVINKNAFEKLSDTENSQGVAAVVLKKENPPLSFYIKSNFIVALDRISDPGNLGTVIRSAYWFGAGGILISKDSVDLYNPKVLRSMQGALFHLNVSYNIDLPESLDELRAGGFDIFLLDVRASKHLNETQFNDKSVFVFGNEAEGISGEITNRGFERISIKGYSECESLNVASSSAIVMNEFKNRFKAE